MIKKLPKNSFLCSFFDVKYPEIKKIKTFISKSSEAQPLQLKSKWGSSLTSLNAPPPLTSLLVPFFVGSFLGVFVRSREAPENGNMRCFIVQWTIEIIKQLIERLLEEGVDRLNEKAEICFAPELDSCAI